MLKGQAKTDYQREYQRAHQKAYRQRQKGLITRSNQIPDGSNQGIPLYNPAIHRTGDTVQVMQGKRLVTITIPELDAEGNAMYEEG